MNSTCLKNKTQGEGGKIEKVMACTEKKTTALKEG